MRTDGPAEEAEPVAVVGAGVMGAAIAQTLATAGFTVVCVDRSAEQLAAAQQAAESGRYGLARAVERGKLTSNDAAAARERLTFTDDLVAAVADARLVIEAIPEELELKLDLFAQLGPITGHHTVLASNTSGLPVAALGAAARCPERVLAWHWASPAQVRPFAEIAVTKRTAPWARELVVRFAERCGKRPVTLVENAREWGFVANRVFFAALREAERVRDEGLADEAAIDRLLCDAYAWPVGPFAVMRGASEGWGDGRAGTVGQLLAGSGPARAAEAAR
jgi:3-hydroxybutyryl-CoA dehydrogenase/3-hydroxyacyl-CoA dehydrogenase